MSIYAQTSTNIDVIHDLVDQSMDQVTSGLPFEDIAYYFTFTSLPEYQVIKNRALAAFSRKLSVTDDKSKSLKSIVYNLDNIKVDYKEPFKDGFFGSYLVERECSIAGSYIISSMDKSIKSEDFALSAKDTVEYSKISSLESYTLPFTRSEIPPEPLLGSLLEPAIAISAIAVTIILFFTVRSN